MDGDPAHPHTGAPPGGSPGGPRPGPGPHKMHGGGDGGGHFLADFVRNGPVYLFWVIFVYKILEDFRMGAGPDSVP